MAYDTGRILYIDNIDGDTRFRNVTLKITSGSQGDYFDLKGNFLGSTEKSRKHIYIMGRDYLQKPYSSTNLPEGFYDKFVSFNGIGNIINFEIGRKYVTIITDLSLETRINVVEKIYNHYYQEAGYDLNRLKFKTITDATLDPSNTGYAVTKLGGVSQDSEYLRDNEADIRIVYGHIGQNFDTGYDIMSVCAHEHFHLEELIKLGKDIFDKYHEDRAYRYQAFIDKNWSFVSIGFKIKMLEQILLNMWDTDDKMYYKKARGDEKQYEGFVDKTLTCKSITL